MTDALELVGLADGDVEVEILPRVGARLHRVRAFGVEVLRTPDDPRTHLDQPWFWGSYPLVPWCNRLPAGPLSVAGRVVDLPPNFSDGTAIHGQVAVASWSQDGASSWTVRAGGDGWPWRYEARQTIELAADRLTLMLALTNRDETPMPAGLGIHPWFRDPLHIAIRAAAVHPSNLDPSRDPEPVRGDLDRREAGPLAVGVDAAWTDLAAPPVVLVWPRDGVHATVETSPTARYVVAARLAGVDATAVEPETHAPAGLRRLLNGEPGGLELLPPGETLSLAVSLRFERLET